MSRHKAFRYKSLDELKADIQRLELDLPLSEDLSPLKQSVKLGNKVSPNSLVVQPMEGCDAALSGEPDELVYRRYRRFAQGGAGVLWGEACAVVHEGRANPRQLYISREKLPEFKKMVEELFAAAKEKMGEDHRPYTVLQLTHSGRYSNPGGGLGAILAMRDEILDPRLGDNYRVITDEEIKALEDKFVEAAELARDAGFDAVDIKACHRYLNSELLASFTREGEYGGSFVNRIRFLTNIVDKIKGKLGDTIDVTLRMNAYDAHPYPYGWGVDKDDFTKPDLTEPIQLIRILRDKGVNMVNISCGNPYYRPHIGRPYDTGPYVPEEHPLEGVARMLKIAKEIQQGVPEVAVVATGLSWLRDYAPYVAAGGIKEGWFKLAGFGRQAFAYPDFAYDILTEGQMFRRKSCIACGKCTELMRFGSVTGCVIKDNEVYLPIYNEARSGKPSMVGKHIADHL